MTLTRIKKFFTAASTATVLLLSFSCSTTRVLQDGEYRLAKNTVKVENDSRFNPGSLTL